MNTVKTKPEPAPAAPALSKKDADARNEIATLQLEKSRIDGLHTCAIAVAKGTIATGLLWLELCKFIRQNSIAPKVVSRELGSLGFVKTRISEVNRVANAADEVWNEYEARGLGFRHALDLVRNGKPTPILALAFDAKEGQLFVEAGPKVPSEQSEGAEGTESAAPTKDQEAVDAESLARAVKTLLQKAAALGVKQRTFSSETHVVTIKAKTKAQRSKVSASGPVVKQ